MRKCNFTWELRSAGWKWEASHYEGNGIFYGKVTSPYTSGDYGTWYLWEILQNGAVLTKGSQADVDKLTQTKGAKKAMMVQQAWQEASTPHSHADELEKHLMKKLRGEY